MIVVDKPNFKEIYTYKIKKFDDDNFELIVLKTDTYRNNNDDEEIEDIEEILEPKSYYYKLDNNISRARTKIFEYAMSNDFDFFVTLTLNYRKQDRYCLDNFIKNFGQFIRNYRSKYGIKVEYLLIPELHKDNAWHMHGLIKGIRQEDLFYNENGYLDWRQYKAKFGYISMSRVRSKIAISKYITKYLTKSIDSHNDRKHKKLYYHTRGLKKPSSIESGVIRSIDEARLLEANEKTSFSNCYVSKFSLNKEQFQILQNLNILFHE